MSGWKGSSVWRLDWLPVPRQPAGFIVVPTTAEAIDRLIGVWPGDPFAPTQQEHRLGLAEAFDALPAAVEYVEPRSHVLPETTHGCPVLAGWMRPEAVDEIGVVEDMAWRAAGATLSETLAARRRAEAIHSDDAYCDMAARRWAQGVGRNGRKRKRWLDALRTELRERDAARRNARNESEAA
jgi:hypothetical protein